MNLCTSRQSGNRIRNDHSGSGCMASNGFHQNSNSRGKYIYSAPKSISGISSKGSSTSSEVGSKQTTQGKYMVFQRETIPKHRKALSPCRTGVPSHPGSQQLVTRGNKSEITEVFSVSLLFFVLL